MWFDVFLGCLRLPFLFGALGLFAFILVSRVPMRKSSLGSGSVMLVWKFFFVWLK